MGEDVAARVGVVNMDRHAKRQVKAHAEVEEVEDIDEMQEEQEVEDVQEVEEAHPEISMVDPVVESVPMETIEEEQDEEDDKKHEAMTQPRAHNLRKMSLDEELLGMEPQDKEDAAAQAVAKAQIKLDLAQNEEALELGTKAQVLYLESGDAIAEAEALRLIVKVHLAEDDVEIAQELGEGQLARFKESGDRFAEATMGLALAEVFIARDRPKQGLRVATDAVQTFRLLKRDPGIGQALQLIAKVHLMVHGKLGAQRAQAAATEALELFRKLGDTKEESATHLILCKVHLTKQEYDEAYDQACSAVQVAQENDNKKGELNALQDVARVVMAAKGDPEEAVKASLQAIEIAEEINDPLGIIASRLIIADAYISDGNPSEALDCMEGALSLAREINARRQIAQAMEVIVSIHMGSGQIEDATQAIEEELKLAKESGSSRRTLTVLQNLATLHLSTDRGEEALQCAQAAVSLFTDSSDRKGLSWALQLVSEVHSGTQQYEEFLTSSEKAREVLQEVGDYKGAVQVLQMTMAYHMQMNSSVKALEACLEMRSLYQIAGWREEEAQAMVHVAEVILNTKGPREAVKAAKEAVNIFKDIGDETGEADTLLILADFQLASNTATEALRTTTQAGKLYKALDDVQGQSKVMRVAANVYMAQGASEEALRTLKTAQSICQKAGDKKGEATALAELANVHVTMVQREADAGKTPSNKLLQDAIEAATEYQTYLRDLGDKAGEVTALQQMATLHLLAEDDEASLNCARESLEFAVELNDPACLGAGLLAVARAYMSAGEHSEAKQAAEDAIPFFEQTGDEAGYEAAVHIVEEAAKEPPPKVTKAASKAPEFKQSQMTRRPMGESNSTSASNDLVHRDLPKGKPLNRKGFSQVVEQATVPDPVPEVRSPPSRPSRPPPSRRDEPNQEQRRRQLAAATEAKASAPKFVEEEKIFRPKPVAKSVEHSLTKVLQQVRPDWKYKDLIAVQEKLAKIQIYSFPELFRRLSEEDGIFQLNESLKGAGQKTMKTETLETLRSYGAEVVGEQEQQEPEQPAVIQHQLPRLGRRVEERLIPQPPQPPPPPPPQHEEKTNSEEWDAYGEIID